MLTRFRQSTEEREQGFTLVELLVVVIIIGILAAIAIPTFLNQRQKAWERAAQSDLRNAATVMEGHYGDAGSYDVAATPTLNPATDFKVSEGVTLSVATANATEYCILATHTKLASTASYRLKSSVGRPEAGSACT